MLYDNNSFIVFWRWHFYFSDDIPEWEKELQAELQEYEVVGDENVDDADLEREIMKQIEAESTHT